MSRENVIKLKTRTGIFTEEDFMKACPEYELVPTVLPPVNRIIAIGDIHGDYDLAVNSFKLAKLIDDDMNWIAEPPDTVVVQVGDQIDSCRPILGLNDCSREKQSGDKNEDMKVLHFFNNMHRLAAKYGGAVYSLLGNHELMNAEGNFTYTSYANLHEFDYEKNGIHFKGEAGRRSAFKPGNEVAQMLACTRNSVIIIGSNMFVHAGILPDLATKLDYYNFDSHTKLEYLNNIVRRWLLTKISSKDEMERLIIEPDISPFWTRVFGAIPPNTKLDDIKCSESVGKIMKVFKIGQIVVGHTPQLISKGYGINGTCYEKETGTNKLYRVDGGFSRAFKIFEKNDIIQVLEIIDDNKFVILR
jgi:hypothetical protein